MKRGIAYSEFGYAFTTFSFNIPIRAMTLRVSIISRACFAIIE